MAGVALLGSQDSHLAEQLDPISYGLRNDGKHGGQIASDLILDLDCGDGQVQVVILHAGRQVA